MATFVENRENDKNDKFVWTQFLMEKLCEAYRGEPVVYRSDHGDYHNRGARMVAWRRIAKRVDPGLSGKMSILTMCCFILFKKMYI